MSRLKTQRADLFALSFTSVVGKAYGVVSILLRRRQQRHLFHDNTYVAEMYLPVSLHFSDGRTGNQTLSGIPYLVERHRKPIIPCHRECKRHETKC